MREFSNRGQTEVLGVVFSFVVILGLIGINQLYVVPQTNKEVERQHDAAVQGDMVELRNEAIQAAASNDPQTVSVQLGVRYPTRFVATNPPPVSGTLETVEGGNITVENARIKEVCGTNSQPDTKFWRYEAEYNEYSSGLPITIENTVTHRGTDDVLTDTKPVVVRGNVIRIIRYVGDYQANGIEPQELELIPSRTGQGVINSSSEINVTLPTRMDNETWNDLLSTEKDDGFVERVNASGGDNVTITITGPSAEEAGPDQLIVRCTTIGIEEEPDVDPSFAGPIDASPEEIINPVGPDVVQLVSVTEPSNGPEDLDAKFWNRKNETQNLTEARVPYVNGPGGSAGETVDLTNDSDSVSLEIGGEFKNVSELGFEIEPNDNGTLSIDGINPQNTGVALKLKFEDPDNPNDNSTYTYFLSKDE